MALRMRRVRHGALEQIIAQTITEGRRGRRCDADATRVSSMRRGANVERVLSVVSCQLFRRRRIGPTQFASIAEHGAPARRLVRTDAPTAGPDTAGGGVGQIGPARCSGRRRSSPARSRACSARTAGKNSAPRAPVPKSTREVTGRSIVTTTGRRGAFRTGVPMVVQVHDWSSLV